MNNRQLNHEEYIKEQRKFPICLILDNISDPLNLGSIFRIADAFGVEKILISTSNPKLLENKKILRISRNTLDHVDYEVYGTIEECIDIVRKENIKVLALEITNQSISINKYNFKKNLKYAFIIGNEKDGVSIEALNKVDDTVHIDMYGNNSSMNVSVAVSIAIDRYINKII